MTYQYQMKMYKYPWDLFIKTVFVLLISVLLERFVCIDNYGVNLYILCIDVIVTLNVIRKLYEYFRLKRIKKAYSPRFGLFLWRLVNFNIITNYLNEIKNYLPLIS